MNKLTLKEIQQKFFDGATEILLSDLVLVKQLKASSDKEPEKPEHVSLQFQVSIGKKKFKVNMWIHAFLEDTPSWMISDYPSSIADLRYSEKALRLIDQHVTDHGMDMSDPDIVVINESVQAVDAQKVEFQTKAVLFDRMYDTLLDRLEARKNGNN